jgi:DcuC family C4-dicarboxylate transporter
MFLNIAAALVTVLTFIAIIRRVETRLALLAGGLAMAVLSLKPQAWSEAFTRNMTSAGLISVILPVMGFAAVMDLTGCNRHLVKMLTDPLMKVRFVLVPAAMLVTYLMNIAISSAAGCAATVGVVLIPAMMAAGIHPAMAAAAVFAGTWGSVFSPGSPHPAVIAKIANMSVIEVILAHKAASIAAALIVAAILFVETKLFRQDQNWTPEKAGSSLNTAGSVGGPTSSKKAAGGGVPPDLGGGPDANKDQKQEIENVNVIRAIVPLVPLMLLIITFPQLGLTTQWLPNGLTVLEAMMIGTVLGMVVTRISPVKVTKDFFDGMGNAYGGIIGIIIAAGVFIGGLEAAGVIGSLINLLKEVKSAVPVLGTFGPFVMAVLSGSGDAAALAFNNAVTPHAPEFGITHVDLGNLAWIGGALGRSMSPVAAACIIAAGFAGMNPFEVAKRNVIPMIVAAVAVVLIM